MNGIAEYLIQITLSAALCIGIVAYLRQSLRPILVDLCGTETRARFWVAFASILLIGLPLVFSMGYNPTATSVEAAFFEIVNQVKIDLLGFLLALMVIGAVISFFALIAPRPATK